MKVIVAGPVKKRMYEYKTININQTGLKGWEISTIWGNRAPIKDVDINDNGNIFITVRRKIKQS